MGPLAQTYLNVRSFRETFTDNYFCSKPNPIHLSLFRKIYVVHTPGMEINHSGSETWIIADHDYLHRHDINNRNIEYAP